MKRRALSKVEQRERLFRKQRGRCYWCKEPMKLHTPNARPRDPRTCTTDHLHDRWSPLRGKVGGAKDKVAACLECNNKRSKINEAAYRRDNAASAKE